MTCQRPAGAFYVFPQIEGFGPDVDDVASRLLHEAGVAVLAGSAFGDIGRDSLRLSYANSRENLLQAIDQIGSWLATAQA